MRFFVSQVIYLVRNRASRRNVVLLLKFFLVLAMMVTTYSVIFHYLMAREGKEYTWVTGFYWALTVMSTLGLGDITFSTDLGRIFSMFVLLSGMVFLLVLLPFTFIEFFYEPWMEAQSASRAPRELPPATSGHVVLTHYDEVTSALIHKLVQYHYPYVLLVPDLQEALRLYDLGLRVVVGGLDHPDTYHKVRVERAALVATTADDMVNTHVAFTVQGLSNKVPIIATANDPASVDILELAGCSNVIHLGEMLGQSLARRTNCGDAAAHVIGQFDQLLIAEASAAGTPMVGKTLREAGLRERFNIRVVGAWERGQFTTTGPGTRISQSTVLVLAGSEAQLKKYDEAFRHCTVSEAPVVIIGGGRVGRATGRALSVRKIDYRIVESLPDRVRDAKKYVLGNAAEFEVLKKAGIMISEHSFAEGVATVRRALELGVTYFDTSPFYGKGMSQAVLGEALEGRSEEYVLATKVGRPARPERLRSQDALFAQFEEGLRLLRRSSVDVLQLHEADWHRYWSDVEVEDTFLDMEADYDFADAPAMQFLRAAREQGLCRYIGITGNNPDHLARVLLHVEVDTCLSAFNYSLVNRGVRRKLMPSASGRGVALILGGAFVNEHRAQVRPDWAASRLPPEMLERVGPLLDLQKESGLSLVAMALRFLIADPDVTTLLIGATTPAEIEENVAAAEAGPLPQDLHQAVEALGLPWHEAD